MKKWTKALLMVLFSFTVFVKSPVDKDPGLPKELANKLCSGKVAKILKHGSWGSEIKVVSDDNKAEILEETFLFKYEVVCK